MTELLSYFPPALRAAVLGKRLTGIHLRRDRRCSFTCYQNGACVTLPADVILSGVEMEELLARLCQGSVYAFTNSLREGYISLPNGIRVGVVGRASVTEGRITAVSEVSSLVFRLPHPVRGAADAVLRRFRQGRCGILVYGPPGSGKTTVLREFAREISRGARPLRCAVVDSREEFYGFEEECLVDLLRGYPKGAGVEIAVRTLSPEVIVLDEIGAEEAESLLRVQCMGVPVVASAHGNTREDLLARPALSALLASGTFRELYAVGAEEALP